MLLPKKHVLMLGEYWIGKKSCIASTKIIWIWKFYVLVTQIQLQIETSGTGWVTLGREAASQWLTPLGLETDSSRRRRPLKVLSRFKIFPQFICLVLHGKHFKGITSFTLICLELNLFSDSAGPDQIHQCVCDRFQANGHADDLRSSVHDLPLREDVWWWLLEQCNPWGAMSNYLLKWIMMERDWEIFKLIFFRQPFGLTATMLLSGETSRFQRSRRPGGRGSSTGSCSRSSAWRGTCRRSSSTPTTRRRTLRSSKPSMKTRTSCSSKRYISWNTSILSHHLTPFSGLPTQVSHLLARTSRLPWPRSWSCRILSRKRRKRCLHFGDCLGQTCMTG